MAISLPDRFLVWEPSVQYRAIQEFFRITGGRHSPKRKIYPKLTVIISLLRLQQKHKFNIFKYLTGKEIRLGAKNEIFFKRDDRNN